jgi:hypothetical protein
MKESGSFLKKEPKNFGADPDVWLVLVVLA